MNNVGMWEQAQRIRAYLNAVREKVDARGESLEPDAPMGRFIAWAHRYADAIDASNAVAGPEWRELSSSSCSTNSL
jgi:hypothetical protein